MTRGFELTIGALWIVFWAFWLLAALTAKRSRPSSGLTAGIAFRLAAAVIVIVVLRSGVVRAGAAATPASLAGLGLALQVVGLGTAFWARFAIGRNWGTPMSQKVDTELVMSGPYRLVRHPIYSGLILAMVGTVLAVGLIWLVVAVVLAAYFVYSALVEERNMLRLFPQQYGTYRLATKRLVPFVW